MAAMTGIIDPTRASASDGSTTKRLVRRTTSR
jgi:hypothetical protein